MYAHLFVIILNELRQEYSTFNSTHAPTELCDVFLNYDLIEFCFILLLYKLYYDVKRYHNTYVYYNEK